MKTRQTQLLRPEPLPWSLPWSWAPPTLALLALVTIEQQNGNVSLFLALNELGRHTDDTFWACVTILGDALVALALCLPLYQRRPDIVWSALIAALFTIIFVHGLKHALNIPRPPAVLSKDVIHIIGPAFRAGSFPSGHAATIATLVGAIVLHQPRAAPPWQRIGLILVMLIVAGSRAIVGVHWPTDILAGLAVGWFAALFAARVTTCWDWGIRPQAFRWINGFLALCAVILLLFHDTRYPQTLWWQYTIATMALGLGWRWANPDTQAIVIATRLRPSRRIAREDNLNTYHATGQACEENSD